MELPVTVVIHKSKQGGYWAQVPAMPGCYSQEETLEELKANIGEAIEGWWASMTERPIEPDEDDDGPMTSLVL
ncbi:MAG: type II toxin-antitoxin system HicB family antitoxin [Isosphaeraceae bacterium]|nr:type II toxin-antitoxin system HicB family antitoxin [Isosphaeraceae bacterium]